MTRYAVKVERQGRWWQSQYWLGWWVVVGTCTIYEDGGRRVAKESLFGPYRNKALALGIAEAYRQAYKTMTAEEIEPRR